MLKNDPLSRVDFRVSKGQFLIKIIMKTNTKYSSIIFMISPLKVSDRESRFFSGVPP